jgi:hypothetical protein
MKTRRPPGPLVLQLRVARVLVYLVELAHAHVQVELLRHVLTGPLRGPVSMDSLEAQVAARTSGQGDEPVGVIAGLRACQLLVEPGQSPGIGNGENLNVGVFENLWG